MTDRQIAGVIFDLDGTIYRGEQLLPGALQTVELLRHAEMPLLFLTNKPIARRQQYSEKLTRLGIPASRDDVINSGWVTARYLQDKHPDKQAFVIGEEPLLEELEAAGIDATTSEPGELVVASMDRTFDYEKLDLALNSLDDETPFIATNTDRTCPTENGEIPDARGMVGAVEGVTGRTLDTVLGKPSETMVRTAVDRLGIEPDQCLMVGDRPETDIRMGKNAGMRTALVLTGVTDASAVEDLEVTPDHIIDSLAELPEILAAHSRIRLSE